MRGIFRSWLRPAVKLLSSVRRRPRRFVARVESLESRDLPSLGLDWTSIGPRPVFGMAQDQFNTLQTASPAPGWQLLNAGGEIGTVLVDPNNPANIYVYGPLSEVPGGQGIVSLSTNGGARFQSAATGIVTGNYPPSQDFSEDFYQAIAINPLDSSNMVVGTFHIYQSLNAGTSDMTWTQVSSDLTDGDHTNDFISAVAITEVNGQRVYFAGTISGKLWVSSPNPSSASSKWTEIDGGPFAGVVQTIAVNPANPQELFVQDDASGGGGVWHTTDQGQQWTNITGNLPGTFSVNSLAVDWRYATPQLYAGTSRGVYWALAAGGPWVLFGNGMPHTDVDSLELLPNLGVLAAASYGNGAFEVQLPAPGRGAAFIEALYQDVLGRVASNAEVQYWLTALDAQGQNAVATRVARSPEAYTDLVNALYLKFLNRPATGDPGAAFWVNELEAGATQEQVTGGIVTSAEFAARANALVGNANPDFNYVQALYLLLLNRSGSSVEVKGWLAVLPSLGRAGVANRFLTSTEYRTDTVQGFYGSILNRTGSAAEVGFWVGSGLDIYRIEIDFLASAEFYSDE